MKTNEGNLLLYSGNKPMKHYLLSKDNGLIIKDPDGNLFEVAREDEGKFKEFVYTAHLKETGHCLLSIGVDRKTSAGIEIPSNCYEVREETFSQEKRTLESSAYVVGNQAVFRNKYLAYFVEPKDDRADEGAAKFVIGKEYHFDSPSGTYSMNFVVRNIYGNTIEYNDGIGSGSFIVGSTVYNHAFEKSPPPPQEESLEDEMWMEVFAECMGFDPNSAGIAIELFKSKFKITRR
jgi:hypothetical protein